MVLRDVSLIPTNQGTKQELHECLELAALKGIKPVIQVSIEHHKIRGIGLTLNAV
jgi:D-arabinose 1-dehydrogenase-like Zn-dependent alcohol dehydrogenase